MKEATKEKIGWVMIVIGIIALIILILNSLGVLK